MLSALSGCGKIGEPLPPIPRAPLVVNELSVTQQGSRLILAFPLVRPPRAEGLQRIDIFRLIEPESAPPGLTEEEFAARATVISSISGEQVAAGSTTITHQDPLDLRQQPKGLRYRYAVRLFNQAGRGADFSNYATITPLTELASAPPHPSFTLTQTELVITWSPPETNENGTRPANIAGYNLYRKTGANVTKLNAQPLKDTRYVDKAFQFGVTYEYFVRSLSAQLPAPSNTKLNETIEGNASETLVVTPKDTFAPTAPASITIASINGQVSLFWPSNPEADLAGYNIYRAEDEAAPTDKWIKLNARLHTPTTFRDDRVQVGKRYFYQITAVDTANNESSRSATVSETVNP
ncbi:MAG: hypothetical protein HYR56_13905 [Acidobacteria bacterium]|nr:hypothetical protein [Acidobacteriota bacterium]MBI3425269.1 hypothetical protein [Acidobacteriota bacterium]